MTDVEKVANYAEMQKICKMADALARIHDCIKMFTREEQQRILAAANVLIGNKK